MWIQKAKIIDGKILYNQLGIINRNELAPGLADAFYIHHQDTASNVWNVVHNLGKHPSVFILDSSNEVVYGHIKYLTDAQLQIFFKYPFAGIAICN